MVRPLTKCTTQGDWYTRPPPIEKSIGQALGESLATLLSRATMTDRGDPQYLASEVLVHLIRNALRSGNSQIAYALLECLGQRCVRMLRRKVRPSRLFDATDVYDEAVSRLYELFAQDAANPAVGVLDFYEVRFNKALAALRTSVIRDAIRQGSALDSPLEPLPDVETDEGLDQVEWASLARLDADPAGSAESAEFWRKVQKLPLPERQAILGKYVYGLKVESNDPTEITVASFCKVSGSEIRSRLRSAKALLEGMEEQSC